MTDAEPSILCARCGYRLLRRSRGDHCPECGLDTQVTDDRLLAVEARILERYDANLRGAQLCRLVAGLCLVMFFFVIIMTGYMNDPGGDTAFIGIGMSMVLSFLGTWVLGRTYQARVDHARSLKARGVNGRSLDRQDADPRRTPESGDRSRVERPQQVGSP